MYEYRASVERIVDGDTIHCTLDLGCGVFKKETLRLWGINAPELRGRDSDAGIASREWLISKLTPHDYVTIRTHKDKSGKYGRLLGDIWVGGINLNTQMVRDGMAVEYMK